MSHRLLCLRLQKPFYRLVEQHAPIDECHVTAVREDNQFRAMDERMHLLRERRVTFVEQGRDFDRGQAIGVLPTARNDVTRLPAVEV
jgi:hypothetical protein